MSDVLIRTIDAAHAADACLPIEPFRLWGRMIPSLKRGKWGYETEVFEQVTEMCFPDEPYDAEQDDAFFLYKDLQA